MYVLRPVRPASAVCLSSVLSKRGTLQYVGINTCTIVLNCFKEMVVCFKLWNFWSFSWTDLDLVALYVLKIYLFWQ